MGLGKRYLKGLLRMGVLIIPIVIIAWVLGNRFFSTKGYEGTGDFVASMWNEFLHAQNAETDEVELLIDEKGMAFLERRVDKTKARGIHTNKGGDNYVKGKLVFKGDTLKVEVRIKGHMMDHFQGDKWSYRVKMKGKDLFRGMSRCTFQHPGTRSYLNEWIYHQMAQQEGLIALQYDFFRLKLNGEDLGIYALEEHFGQELAFSNGKSKGSFLRWNPNLYWEGRLDEMDHLDITKTQYMDYSAAYVDAYAEGDVKDDSVLIENYKRATFLLEQFRRGKMKTSEVFDVQKLAVLHAIIDLVGGYRSLDWSDVKFYYNGITDKIEPVAYESTSILPIKSLVGQRSLSFRNNVMYDHHDIMFSDMTFYAAYIKELERISKSKYLNDFFEANRDDISKKRAILSQEFPYKRFEQKPYYENQNRIRKLLATPLGFYAHLRSIEGNKLTIDVANIHEFPFEILEVKCNGEKIKSESYLMPKTRNMPLEYQTFEFEFDQELENKGDKNDVELKFRIPGAELIRELEVTLMPAYVAFDEQKDSSDWSMPEFFVVDEANKKVVALPGEWELDRPVKLPKGWGLIIQSPFEIQMKGNATIITSGDVLIKGTQDNPVRFTGQENNKSALEFSEGLVEIEHCVFENINGNSGVQRRQAAVNLINAQVKLRTTDFVSENESQMALFAFQSQLNANQVYFEGWDRVGNIEFSNLNLNNALVKDSEHGFELKGSNMRSNKTEFIDVKYATLFSFASTGNLKNVKVNESKHAVKVRTNSYVTVENFKGKKIDKAFKAENHNPLKGKTGIKAQNVSCDKCETLKKADHGTEIIVD